MANHLSTDKGEARRAESLTKSRFDHPLLLITYPYVAHCMGACSALHLNPGYAAGMANHLSTDKAPAKKLTVLSKRTAPGPANKAEFSMSSSFASTRELIRSETAQ